MNIHFMGVLNVPIGRYSTGRSEHLDLNCNRLASHCLLRRPALPNAGLNVLFIDNECKGGMLGSLMPLMNGEHNRGNLLSEYLVHHISF